MAHKTQVNPHSEGIPGRANHKLIGRDSETGRFMPVKEARKKPKTTTVETIRRRVRMEME
jgi:hypothetical protein